MYVVIHHTKRIIQFFSKVNGYINQNASHFFVQNNHFYPAVFRENRMVPHNESIIVQKNPAVSLYSGI